jgi:hypothetical protein
VLPRRQLTRCPAPRTPVTLRTRAGRKLASFEPRAPVARLIVTSKFVAALEREDSGWQIETLAPVDRVVRLAHQPDVVKATGSTVVFAVGGSVYVFDARAGRPQVIAHASVRPIGLSVIGRRVAWAENLRRGAWIRSFELP